MMHSAGPLILLAIFLLTSSTAEAQHFKVGFAKQDITPTKATPMWGYGARHAALSIGVRDPLYAKAVVIDVGTEKLAIVGLDLGRSPTDAMMVRIRAAILRRMARSDDERCGRKTQHQLRLYAGSLR